MMSNGNTLEQSVILWQSLSCHVMVCHVWSIMSQSVMCGLSGDFSFLVW